MLKILGILSEKNLLTNTRGTNKKRKLFNFTVNMLMFYKIIALNMMTCGLYSLINILIYRLKKRA